MSNVLRVERPSGARAPLVFDSPHSGSIYPDDFGHAIDRMTLRRSEDAHIDELFAHVTDFGASFVHALFPRSYVDPNRNEDDLDLDLIAGDWSRPVNPSPKTLNRGVGLIWKDMKAFGPIYDRLLSSDEVARRIDAFWRPYHRALAEELDDTFRAFGRVVHVNCHSMASYGDRTTEDGEVARPDFVIGDRDGTSCGGAVTDCVVETLRSLGYSVAINTPYKGYELVRRHGRPAENRHSIQIEVNRGLYMDERTLAKTSGFTRLSDSLVTLSGALRDVA